MTEEWLDGNDPLVERYQNCVFDRKARIDLETLVASTSNQFG